MKSLKIQPSISLRRLLNRSIAKPRRGRGRGKMRTGICLLCNWEIRIGFLGTGMPKGGNWK